MCVFMCMHVDSVCAFHVNLRIFIRVCVCVFFFCIHSPHAWFVCLHHALLLCVCASASANHNSPFRILTPSFHHIVSQSQLADESQVPAGLTRNSREREKKKKKERENLDTPSPCSLFPVLFPVAPLTPFKPSTCISDPRELFVSPKTSSNESGAAGF